jgi:CubicO group peptidase (beta-lactamase class C family)
LNELGVVSCGKITADRLGAILEESLRDSGVPGAVAAIVLDGEITSATFGTAAVGAEAPIRPQARFQMGCHTKVMTALIALQLVAERKLELESPLSTYCPELRHTRCGSDICVAHLLSHTSGYQGVHIGLPEIALSYSWQKFLALLSTGEQLFEPGTVFNYEHTEYVLVGEIVRRITGSEIEDLFRQRIAAPLHAQLGSSRRDLQDPDAEVIDHVFDRRSGRHVRARRLNYCRFWTASLADLSISMPDMAALGHQILCGAAGGAFSARPINLMRRKVVDLPTTFGRFRRERIPESYGLGLACYEPDVYGHNGSTRGQTSALRIDAARGLSVAVGMNCWRPDLRDRAIDSVLAELRGTDLPVERGSSSWRFSDLVGMYLGAVGMTVRIKEADQALICELKTPESSQALVIKISRSSTGALQIEDTIPYLAIGFFREPTSLDPCVMIGLNTYRKVA